SLAAAELKYCKSETWAQSSPSLSMAATQSSLFLSKETPNTSNPLLLYLLYILTTLGFSILHGLHQAAQKSMSTYFPLKEDRAIVSPSGLGNAISGAISPTAKVLMPFTDATNCWVYFELGRFSSKCFASLSKKGKSFSGSRKFTAYSAAIELSILSI